VDSTALPDGVEPPLTHNVRGNRDYIKAFLVLSLVFTALISIGLGIAMVAIGIHVSDTAQNPDILALRGWSRSLS
jgi:hypothetical protein